MRFVVGDGGRGSMLPDSGQSKWTALLAGDQGSVCLHTAQLEGGRGVGQGSLSHTISFFQMKLISLNITVQLKLKL